MGAHDRLVLWLKLKDTEDTAVTADDGDPCCGHGLDLPRFSLDVARSLRQASTQENLYRP